MASRVKRAILLAGAVVLAGLAVLHGVNYARLDPGELETRAAPILAEAQALSERARPEYQDLALATLPRNALNGDYHRLDDLLPEAEVTREPAPAGEAGIVHEFSFTNGAADLEPAGGPMPTQVIDGRLKVTTDGAAYLTNAEPIAIPRDEVGDLLITAKADKGTYLRLAWSAREASPEKIWRDGIDVRFAGKGEFHTYQINARNALKRGLAPGDTIKHLYIRPSDAPGAAVEIESIRFLSKSSRFAAAANGVDYETLGNELRRVLYMRPNQTIEYRLKLPALSPRLDFGTGVLLDGRPLRFRVSLIPPAGPAETVFDREVTGTAWRDQRIDLARFAGQEVRLALEIDGDPANVAFWTAPILSQAPERRFNVVVVLEDAQRADYLSVYGHPTDTTPNKRALAQDRLIVFDRAISQETKTRPSIASLMTSLYPTAHGLWYFSDALSERHLTLAEVLHAQGYLTASFIQNGNAGPYAGMHQGFDRLTDEVGMGGTPQAMLEGPLVESWLETHRDRNFLLYLHVIDPHAPYDPPEAVRDEVMTRLPAETTPVTPDLVFDPPWLDRPSAESRRLLYEAEIRNNDRLVPRLLAKLDELGLTEDTLVIFTSDHGEHLADRDFMGYTLWDHRPPGFMTVTHVPLMFLYEKRFGGARRVTTPVQLIDVMPTILELAGVDRTDLLQQGHSLVGLLDGADPERWQDRVVVSEEALAMDKADPCTCGSLFFRDWHLMSSSWLWPRRYLYADNLQAFMAPQVWRVAADGRTESLARSFLPDAYSRWVTKGILDDLRLANLETWRKLTAGEAGGLRIDPDTLERLKGLGYVN